MTEASGRSVTHPSLGGIRVAAVTGVHGFVGPHLVRRRVESGNAVRALSRTSVSSDEHDRVQWFRADVAALGGLVPSFPLTRTRVDALTNRAHCDTLRIMADLRFVYSVPLLDGVRRLVVSLELGAAVS